MLNSWHTHTLKCPVISTCKYNTHNTQTAIHVSTTHTHACTHAHTHTCMHTHTNSWEARGQKEKGVMASLFTISWICCPAIISIKLIQY